MLTFENAEGNSVLLAQAVREGRVIVDERVAGHGSAPEREKLERRAKTDYRSQKRRAFAGIERLLAES